MLIIGELWYTRFNETWLFGYDIASESYSNIIFYLTLCEYITMLAKNSTE